jgi:hypothetical protein
LSLCAIFLTICYSLHKLLSFDRNEFYRNPDPNFDIPPPNFEEVDENGWTTLAKAIVTRDSGLRKYVDYAKRWKQKEIQWNRHYATNDKSNHKYKIKSPFSQLGPQSSTDVSKNQKGDPLNLQLDTKFNLKMQRKVLNKNSMIIV